MNSNKTVFRTILSVLIIIAFFLPWFKFGGGSGLDVVMSKTPGEEMSATIVRYSFLLIPLFALFVLIRSITGQSANFILRLLPFLVTAILTALFIVGVKSQGGGEEELRSWFSVLGYGYFINVVASLLLIFV
ncbi:MAG: hypothetical protein JST17_01270 [Bacteroidetes bacterium]|nr:hypothetical protein [Bacteroidota bacterium]MBS1931914.1 hypothetical protein [Bacteroidota bacterium]